MHESSSAVGGGGKWVLGKSWRGQREKLGYENKMIQRITPWYNPAKGAF